VSVCVGVCKCSFVSLLCLLPPRVCITSHIEGVMAFLVSFRVCNISRIEG